jgi:membrane protein
MTMAAAPPPIPGTPIDPPPAGVPGYATRLERTTLGRVGHRALRRYSHAHVGLLASGTAYYLILSLFSLMAFAYGVIAVVGADELAGTLTDALGEALPGLVGDAGIDPDTLRSTGRTAGIIGLLLLLYGGLGAVGAASSSLHLIFGAPPDPRKFLQAKTRHTLILLSIAPLVVVSFASVGLASSLIRPALEALDLDGGPVRAALVGVGFAVGFVVDALIVWILLGQLGGIRPSSRARMIASLIGAVAVAIIKLLLDLIVSWALAKPQYGAFAAPLAALFIMSLLSTALYASAAIAAGISDAAGPLEGLEPAPQEAGDDPAAREGTVTPDGGS